MPSSPAKQAQQGRAQLCQECLCLFPAGTFACGENPKVLQNRDCTSLSSWRCSSRSICSSLPLDALPVSSGWSPSGAMCPLGRAEGTEVLILLPQCCMGLPSWLGKGFMPQVYLVPLGQQFQWLTVLWCLSVPHRLRGAEMDPLPAQPMRHTACP